MSEAIGFSQHFLAELKIIKEDAGERGLLSCHANQVRHLAVADLGIIADVDSPEGLGR